MEGETRTENAVKRSAHATEIVYCCRKCRRVLFRDANLSRTPHDKLAYSFTKGKAAPCTSYFLNEPETWMDCSEQEGKLSCPQCDTRFGTYVWAGGQCSCGFWVVPAIQVPMSKVDPRKVRIQKSEEASS